MIQSLTVTNYLGESLTIPMMNSESTGFILHDMTGLGPPTASVNTSKVATKDGSKYNSARAEERNIVLPMYFTPVPTIEDARHRSYKYFPLKKPVILAFKTDNRECQIVGYVETNEPDICSDREGCQVSIICPNPYFSSIYDTVTSFSGVEAAFEFPFSNEDTLDTTNLPGTRTLNLAKSLSKLKTLCGMRVMQKVVCRYESQHPPRSRTSPFTMWIPEEPCTSTTISLWR